MLGMLNVFSNFHVFVLASTLLYYILLRLYKRSVLNQEKNVEETSNLIYVLFIPVLLYLTKFLFLKSQIISNNYYGAAPSQINSAPVVDRYIRTPYPESSISSASITI